MLRGVNPKPLLFGRERTATAATTATATATKQQQQQHDHHRIVGTGACTRTRNKIYHPPKANEGSDGDGLLRVDFEHWLEMGEKPKSVENRLFDVFIVTQGAEQVRNAFALLCPSPLDVSSSRQTAGILKRAGRGTTCCGRSLEGRVCTDRSTHQSIQTSAVRDHTFEGWVGRVALPRVFFVTKRSPLGMQWR